MKNILKYALLCITLLSATILGMNDPYYDDDAIQKERTPTHSADENFYVGSYNSNMLCPLPRVGDRSGTRRTNEPNAASEAKKQEARNSPASLSVPASDSLANPLLNQVKEKRQEVQQAIAAKGEDFEQGAKMQEILKQIDNDLENSTSLSQQALEKHLETLGTVLESLKN